MKILDYDDAFSLPHIVSYSMILMVEMNIAYRFGSLYWKAANLNVESGIIGDSESGTNYGQIAKAMENFKEDILPPSASKSDVGFVPDINTGKILYGLKAITGFNIEVSKQIVNNRPYADIQDFYEKNVTNGLVTDKKMVTLIKSGLFDEIDPNRRQVMIDFISLITPNKKKLTAVHIKKIRNDIPQGFSECLEIYDFRESVRKLKHHNNFMDEYIKKYNKEADKLTTKTYPDSYYYDDDGNFVIELKVFEKLYKKVVEPLMEWLKSEEALDIETRLRKREFWMEECLGSLSKWEMESINFYIGDHELDEYPLENFFNVSNFEDMPLEPDVEKYRTGRGGKKWPVYKTNVIAGTVVDTIPIKGIAIVITQFGVVQVRVGKGRFQHYHKKIMVDIDGKRVNIDDTWFKRGTKLLFVGYRRHNDFYCNANNSPYEHSVMKINGVSNGEVIMQTQKKTI